MTDETLTLEDSFEAINERFYEQGWTDGLPIVPPTRDRVERMLRGSSRSPDEELGAMAPINGITTVRKVATNAVMAGARPEYLPVILAAIEALLDPAFNLLGVQATTHPCAPLAIVNGPIAKQLGINGRYNCFGQGWRANATIGRAIRLCLINIGGGRPGVLDRATHGMPSKYTFCIAENEEETPWDPLHVERGFKREQSTVTVCGVENPHNLNDHISTRAEGVLTMYRGSIAQLGSNNAYLYGEPILVVGPEHAAILARDGIGKKELREDLFRNARVPRETWEKTGMYGMPGRGTNLFPDDAMLPMFRKPENLMVIVAGGPGRHSMWLPTFGAMTKAVTRPIQVS